MKNITIATISTLVLASTTFAKSPPKSNTVEQLAIEIADVYVRQDLGRLDLKYPVRGKVKIEIEDSLSGGDTKARSIAKVFQNFAQAEKWLRSRSRDELPVRESRPLIGCKQGSCTYDFTGGLLHNHLYLKKISYGDRNGRPYLKTIYLLDGN